MFPINRRHQGLATITSKPIVVATQLLGFQSIGVTKDWRPDGPNDLMRLIHKVFPINRRHQGLAT